MQDILLPLLRCPVTRQPLRLQVIKKGMVLLGEQSHSITEEGILFGGGDWVYPVTAAIPRLNIESFIDHADFLQQHLEGFAARKRRLLEEQGDLINKAIKKNKRTKESFLQEWNVYDYDRDKTFLEDDAGMLQRFLTETGESLQTLPGKLVLDAGCGNGKLDTFIAAAGATVIAMDFSNSVEKANQRNNRPGVHYLQADVQFPPFSAAAFDIVHCSGVLIHTSNTAYSFSCIAPLVKEGGLLSTWLYHPRKNIIHNLFNATRKITSKLPLKLQYYLYSVTLLPASFIVKRLKGNKQNRREMMVDILDWFSPEFRWEHTHGEAAGWFRDKGFTGVQVTTSNHFGFNITGIKA